MNTPPDSAGLFASLKSMAATLLSIGQTRLELLSNEIETQKLLALRVLLLVFALVFTAGLGTVLLVLMLAMAAGEYRLPVLGVCAAVFLGAAILLYRAVMQAINSPEPAFAATLAELQEDIRQLKSATTHAKAPD